MRAAFYVQGSPANRTFQRYPADPRLAEPRRLRQAGQLPPAARHLQQAVRLRAAGRRPLRRARHRGAARPVRDRRPAADRDDPGPRRAAAARAHRAPSSTPRPGRAVGPAPTTARCRTVEPIVKAAAGARVDRGLPAAPDQLQRPDRRGPDQGHPRAAGGGPARRAGASTSGASRRRRSGTSPACFNASDALITDVSSIASDYLASGKPFAMVRGPLRRRGVHRRVPDGAGRVRDRAGPDHPGRGPGSPARRRPAGREATGLPGLLPGRQHRPARRRRVPPGGGRDSTDRSCSCGPERGPRQLTSSPARSARTAAARRSGRPAGGSSSDPSCPAGRTSPAAGPPAAGSSDPTGSRCPRRW